MVGDSGNGHANGGGERLDSWKAIAAYLGRDAGTVRRWERTRGLPVHRVPGGKGSSVFAYTAEIEAWLKSAPQETPAQEASPVPDEPAAPAPRGAGSWWRWAVASAAIAGALLLGWRMQRPSATVADLRIATSSQTVTAHGLDDRVLWVHRLGDDYKHVWSENSEGFQVLGGATPAVYYATSYRHRRSDHGPLTGVFTSLDLQGRPRWTFQFDDTLEFGGKPYGAPWANTAFAVADGGARRSVAIAAHHYTWSASLVAILDDTGKRLGTYASHGWLEQLQWLSPDRLAAGGFLESRNGGLVVLIDPSRLDGQTPEAKDSPHHCANCGAGLPLRMAVMPRSEINLATHSRFNRVILQPAGDRLLARTVEVPAQGQGVADAIYEFTPELELLGASFSQRYWEVHDQLEAEKKLDHGRATCPDRDGPRRVDVWSPETGWRTISPGKPRS